MKIKMGQKANLFNVQGKVDKKNVSSLFNSGSSPRTSLDEPGEDLPCGPPGKVPRQIVTGAVDGAESRGLRSGAVGHVATRGHVHRRRRPDHLARVARRQYLWNK